jgi:hypothetical protein
LTWLCGIYGYAGTWHQGTFLFLINLATEVTSPVIPAVRYFSIQLVEQERSFTTLRSQRRTECTAGRLLSILLITMALQLVKHSRTAHSNQRDTGACVVAVREYNHRPELKGSGSPTTTIANDMVLYSPAKIFSITFIGGVFFCSR